VEPIQGGNEMTTYQENEKKAKYCLGCAWLHIGIEVDHNHCDYTNQTWDELGKRANGHIEFMNYKLSSHSQQCRWFWDKKKNPNPSKVGIYYKAPQSDACPKIPLKYPGKINQ